MARKILNGLDLNGKQITNVADGSAANHAVTLSQLEAFANNRDWKESVRVASTANINLASPGASINGVAMATGESFLAKNQSTGAENGIYVWNGAATPATRRSDADASAKVTAGMTVTAVEGTVDPDKRYVLTTNDAIVLGTTALTFTVDAGGGTAYTADGSGIELVGSQFQIELDGTTLSKSASGLRIGSGAAGAGLIDSSGVLAVGQGAGISVAADAVAVDTSVVVRKFAADCAATTNPQTFTHNLGTLDVHVEIREVSTGAIVEGDASATGVNAISVNFGGAPTAGQFRVVVQA